MNLALRTKRVQYTCDGHTFVALPTASDPSRYQVTCETCDVVVDVSTPLWAEAADRHLLERANAVAHLPPERVQPCLLRTWCVLAHGHASPCEEIPRYPIPPSDFGPRRRK